MAEFDFSDDPKKIEILSVSAYLDLLNNSIKRYGARIMGEISEASFPKSGHVYFSLKDETDGSVIRCIIWKSKYDMYGVKIKEGAKVIIYGTPNIHSKYGFSFILETIEYAGEGILKQEYNKLKKKLEDQGYFAEERKKEIPNYPNKIGVITSLNGAVIKDFLNNIGNFGFKIKAIDARVEGQNAVRDLLGAIKTFKKQDIDVLVIMRGGGSLESMQAFNNETLVKEVADFKVPVIAAIGHDKDIPLLSLAADYMVSTPSIAATTLNKSWDRLLLILDAYQRDIFTKYERKLNEANSLIGESISIIRDAKDITFAKWREIETNVRVLINKFSSNILEKKKLLKDSLKLSLSSLRVALVASNRQISHFESMIRIYDPNRQLDLGYSIIRFNGQLIKSVKNIKKGDNLDLLLKDGSVSTEVKKIKKRVDSN